MYKLAAEQGYADAQYNLGYCYATGEGVSQDYSQAYFWFLIAADNGIEDAIANRDLAAELLSASQQTEIQTKAAEWLAKHGN